MPFLRRKPKPGKKKRDKASKLEQLCVRNTARSLKAERTNTSAGWTNPKWKTGVNPGLFVEGGDCCPLNPDRKEVGGHAAIDSRKEKYSHDARPNFY